MTRARNRAEEMMIFASCEDCAYWSRHTWQDGEAILGECRRNPPLKSRVLRNPDITIFPLTFDTDACGEFLQRAEPLQIPARNGDK